MIGRILLIAAVLVGLAGVAGAEMMTVAFTGAELRSRPQAMGTKVVTELPPMSPVEVLEKGDDYHRVQDYRGRTGWLHRSLLTSEPAVVVTAERVNVRQGPGTEHPVVMQLEKGTTAALADRTAKWVQIRTAEGRLGWVADFLVWGE